MSAAAAIIAINKPLVLCQDCRAVSEYSDEKHNDEVICACGGQWCGCARCQFTARGLMRGDSLNVRRGDFWCAETGIRKASP